MTPETTTQAVRDARLPRGLAWYGQWGMLIVLALLTLLAMTMCTAALTQIPRT